MANYLKLVWKGKFKDVGDLPIGDLPEGAVMIGETETAREIAKTIRISLIPVILFLLVVILIRIKIGGFFSLGNVINPWGVVLIPFAILPHEFLHAIVFPKGSEIEMWYSIKEMTAIVKTNSAISKKRFIFLSILPNIILGFLPLILWIFIPNSMEFWGSILFTFGFIELIMGVSDFMNIYNSIKQVPSRAKIQVAGLNSYWYI